MYTHGIRKILTVPKHYGHIDCLTALAERTGHKAVAHNGTIYM